MTNEHLVNFVSCPNLNENTFSGIHHMRTRMDKQFIELLTQAVKISH